MRFVPRRTSGTANPPGKPYTSAESLMLVHPIDVGAATPNDRMFHWFEINRAIFHPFTIQMIDGYWKYGTCDKCRPDADSAFRCVYPVILWVRTVAERGAGGGADIIQF
jgi:hypothetical protein